MDFLSQLTLLQWIGTLFGVVQVLLARLNKSTNYLFGIIAVLISIVVLYQSKLYADILLHLYYLVMSIYGWFYWKLGRQDRETPITHSDKRDQLISYGIVLGCFVLMVYWLQAFTNSDVPYWDSFVSAFAWAGMYLMAKRKLENWIYLNISNLIAIPLLIYKDLYIYAGFTMFLFGVGVSGYLRWKSLINPNRQNRYAEV